MKTKFFPLVISALLFTGCKKKTKEPEPQPETIGCFKIMASDTKQPIEGVMVNFIRKTPEDPNPFHNYAYEGGTTSSDGNWCSSALKKNFSELSVSHEDYEYKKFLAYPGSEIYLTPKGCVKFHVKTDTTYSLLMFFYDGHKISTQKQKFDTTFIYRCDGNRKFDFALQLSKPITYQTMYYKKDSVKVIPRDTIHVDVIY